jgi:lipopolysaccharide export system protein LptA
MKHTIAWVALVLFAGVAVVCGQEQAADDVTVITSDRLTFDYSKQYALFDGNVIVTDPEMKLTSDKLTVRFSEENDVETIIAEGNVRIWQADKVATGGHAKYEVASGRIQLTRDPKVRRGKDLLEGTTITFWRDENKMVCEPQARLVIFPEKGGTRDQLFGE